MTALNYLNGCCVEEGLGLFQGIPMDTNKSSGQKIQVNPIYKVELCNNSTCPEVGWALFGGLRLLGILQMSVADLVRDIVKEYEL